MIAFHRANLVLIPGILIPPKVILSAEPGSTPWTLLVSSPPPHFFFMMQSYFSLRMWKLMQLGDGFKRSTCSTRLCIRCVPILKIIRALNSRNVCTIAIASILPLLPFYKFLLECKISLVRWCEFFCTKLSSLSPDPEEGLAHRRSSGTSWTNFSCPQLCFCISLLKFARF